MTRRKATADVHSSCLFPPEPEAQPLSKPVLPPRVPYPHTVEYLTTPDKAATVLAELLLQQPLGLDIETTGLDPLRHRIRLLQLACRSGRVVVFDLFQLLAALFAPLSKARLVAHNAVFEYAFLAAAGIRLERLHDSMLMYRTLHGHTASLQDAAQQVLLLPLDKAEQVSDWTAPELTEQQLRYAALDAWAALQLGEALGAGRTATYQLAIQALPVVAQCHLDGVPFDWPQHAVLCERWRQDLTAAEQVLQQQLGTANPRSTKQIGDWLQRSLDAATLAAWPRTATGKLQLDRDVLMAHTGHPVLGPLARQRTLQKLLSVYGYAYIKHRHPITQRLHPHYRILGTVAGRFGCSNPNIQQLPADAELRQLVRADPGRLLVCADYSQIELRIAALFSQDALLLAAYAAGADLHAQTALALCGDATRRQLGKVANFGLLYGSGAAGLQAFARSSYGVAMTLPEAAQHRTRFLRTYAGLRQWQQQIDHAARLSKKVHTRAGLVRVLEPYRMTEALNTPVQGSAAEVLLAALGRLPHWLRGLDARLVLHCHDELLLDCAEQDAPAAATALAGCMAEAWQRLFPEAVMGAICDAHTGSSWAAAKG